MTLYTRLGYATCVYAVMVFIAMAFIGFAPLLPYLLTVPIAALIATVLLDRIGIYLTNDYWVVAYTSLAMLLGLVWAGQLTFGLLFSSIVAAAVIVVLFNS